MRALQRQRSVDSLLSSPSKLNSGFGKAKATVPSHRVARHRKSWQNNSPTKTTQSMPQTPKGFNSPYKVSDFSSKVRYVQRSPKAEARIKRQNTTHYLFPSDIDVKEDIPNKHKTEQKHNSIPPELKTFKYETTKESNRHWQSATKDITKNTATSHNPDALVQSPINPGVKVSNPETSAPRTNVQNLFDQTSNNWESPIEVNPVVPMRKAQGQIKPKTPNKKKKQDTNLAVKSQNSVSIGTSAFKVEVPRTPTHGQITSTSQKAPGSVNIDANGVRFQMPKTPSKVIY